MAFEQGSYQKHADHYAEQDSKLVETWLIEDTVDAWRHNRMYAFLDPLLKTYQGASWLTVGDGRYGTDAHYIIGKGGKAHASDISDFCLKEAAEKGFINEWSVENAESLSFDDNSFDFVLCKESYHHFPRPAKALYEMLRVAKKGVILLEPYDRNLTTPHRFSISDGLYTLAKIAKSVLSYFTGKSGYNYGAYEPVGNYIFSISPREMEKVALALNYPFVAFSRLWDYYEPEGAWEKYEDNGPARRKIEKMIKVQEWQNRLGLIRNGFCIALIMKEMPSIGAKTALNSQGYDCFDLPRNPYWD